MCESRNSQSPNGGAQDPSLRIATPVLGHDSERRKTPPHGMGHPSRAGLFQIQGTLMTPD
jgi:hypothetical protein